MPKRKTSNRPRSTRDAKAGYHRFMTDDGHEYGSFHVFYLGRPDIERAGSDAEAHADNPPDRAGWYWQSGFPGCLPDGDATGPFTSSLAAFRNAREEA